MKTTHLPKLGNIWAAQAKIQYMKPQGDRMVWETLATCSDTPNAIRAAANRIQAKGICGMNMLWVSGQATGRKMVSDL